MRIVSLLPSATEIVYALGLQDRLEGVTHECDFPPAARSKPAVCTTSLALDGAGPEEIDGLVSDRVGAGESLYRLDGDRIRDIRPDVILAQDLCRVCAVPSGEVNQALDLLGCRAEVISLDPSTLDDVIGDVTRVGRAAGVEDRAKSVAAALRARVDRVRRAAEGLDRPPVLALEWPDPPFAGGHWVPEMVRIAGGADPLGTEGAASRRVTWDEVAGVEPEVIVYMPCGYYLDDAVAQARRLYDVHAFAALPAAISGRVFAVDASSYFSRPGPRIVDGLETLAWCIHPDVFPAPPPGRATAIGRVPGRSTKGGRGV
jgi:iron complex transport system substrate-binding protein